MLLEIEIERSTVVLLVGEPNKIPFFLKSIIPKKKIHSYSILGTIVTPNKMLLILCELWFPNMGSPLNGTQMLDHY